MHNGVDKMIWINNDISNNTGQWVTYLAKHVLGHHLLGERVNTHCPTGLATENGSYPPGRWTIKFLQHPLVYCVKDARDTSRHSYWQCMKRNTVWLCCSSRIFAARDEWVAGMGMFFLSSETMLHWICCHFNTRHNHIYRGSVDTLLSFNKLGK